MEKSVQKKIEICERCLHLHRRRNDKGFCRYSCRREDRRDLSFFAFIERIPPTECVYLLEHLILMQEETPCQEAGGYV